LKRHEKNNRATCSKCGHKLEKKTHECPKCGDFSEEKYHSPEEVETHYSKSSQTSSVFQKNQKLSEKNIKGFDEFINENKTYEYVQRAMRRGGELIREIRRGVRRESKETREAAEILQKMVMGKPVTPGEKAFLKDQSIDILKVIPLIAIQGIPVPIPITPILIALGRKYGFNILPDSHKKREQRDI
jgi:hypothetical protein